jgi:hypothetical protein
MSRFPPKIRQGDVTRVVKGVEAAGHEVREVVVTRDGEIRVLTGKVEAPLVPESPLEEWRRNNGQG